MKTSLDNAMLAKYVTRQLNNFFPDEELIDNDIIRGAIADTIDRVHHSFKHIKNKYYFKDGSVVFDHLNSDHYASFLYLLSNTVYQKHGHSSISTKIFLLNKALHALDVYYSTRLPDIFMLVHPVGTVLGAAKYSDYFVAYQNCTVGSVDEGMYPCFEEKVIMFSRSSVLGDCKVGNNSAFAANSFIINTSIDSNKVVLGSYPNFKTIENTNNVIDRFFK